MSYIPKPATHTNGAASTDIQIQPALHQRQQFSERQFPDTAYKKERLLKGTVSSKSSVANRNLRIHHCRNNSIVKLYPSVVFHKDPSCTAPNNFADSALGNQSPAYSALGLAPRPVTADRYAPLKADCVRVRHRSTSDSHTGVPRSVPATGLTGPSFATGQAPSPVAANALPPNARAGLPGIKATAKRRPNNASASDEIKPWTTQETKFLAQASLRFWSDGLTVDHNLVARELGRVPKDTRTMLQLMLQEYMLFASKLHWPAENDLLVKKWAAIEFPKCPILTHSRSIRKQSSTGRANIGRCLSLLRCRQTQTHPAPVISEPNKDVNITLPMALVDSKADIKSLASVYDKQNCNDTEPSALIQKSEHTLDSVDAAVDAIAAIVFGKPRDLIEHVSEQSPSTNRKDVNVLSRNSRTRGQSNRRRNSTRYGRNNFARPPNPTATTATDAAIEASPADTKKSSEAKRVSFKATSTAMKADDSIARSALLPTKSSAILSMALLEENQNMDSSKDTELSPEQSKDTSDFNRLDGDIDILHFDVTTAARKCIREFVEKYIERYFDLFFFRAAHPSIEENSRLCAALKDCLDGPVDLSNIELLALIEKEILSFDVSSSIKSKHGQEVSKQKPNLARASLHFHMCFSRAAEKCNIYESDVNWPSANAYATAIFNRAIEDTHYIAFEAFRGASEYSFGSGLSAVLFLRTEQMESRANNYKHSYYMGMVAGLLTIRYVQGPGQQTFLKRVEIFGYRPVPTAIDYDDNMDEEELESELETAWSDVSLRGELHNIIMEAMPFASNKSTMIAMQRSIEIYNKTIVDYNTRLHGEFSSNIIQDIDTLASQETSQVILASIRKPDGVLSAEMACRLAQCQAEIWFNRWKAGILRALMIDHKFMPVPLNDVRRWIIEGRSPNGRNVDFALNIRLYNLLKYLRVRMNEVKWLYASGAATLRVVELAVLHLQKKNLLEHISIDRYTSAFEKFIHAQLHASSKNSRFSQMNGAELSLFCVSPVEAVATATAAPGTEQKSHTKDAAATDDNNIGGFAADQDIVGLEEVHARLEKLAQNNMPSKAASYSSIAVTPLISRQNTCPKVALAANTDGLQQTSAENLNRSADINSLRLETEARIGGLESEIKNIRSEICDVAEIRRDVRTILGLLHNRYSGIS
ncbi:hypothetical protein GGI25_003953 [Coemansia spiralis]|uniref:Uncharacterized protein n=2 Tax=Coemansia TaxID=4863 RepID=A0A9W8KXL4_9FUNG|nr:hypothetical protein EDC05_005683 [Coemansia umbellata]KAJ2620965.1 hypothetical protein GGI26_004571 [Coemansia sp. RSA 1358]KAJ2675536.1 hypothetical protein GGI25_003953 [Coemansia spiralis]